MKNLWKYLSILENYKSEYIMRNQTNFLVYGQGSKKIGLVGRQNKSNIFWFLGSVFFKK